MNAKHVAVIALVALGVIIVVQKVDAVRKLVYGA